jgi:photoactive yellow protein
VASTKPDFETVSLQDLDAMNDGDLDVLPYGVIAFAADTIVHRYNLTEARMAGLDPSTVKGAPFFAAVAQCMNNFMVAQRFEDEPDIDEVMPYTLTLRMRPTKVRMRLMAAAEMQLRYILIER